MSARRRSTKQQPVGLRAKRAPSHFTQDDLTTLKKLIVALRPYAARAQYKTAGEELGIEAAPRLGLGVHDMTGAAPEVRLALEYVLRLLGQFPPLPFQSESEEWRPVPGFESQLAVSSRGRLSRLPLRTPVDFSSRGLSRRYFTFPANKAGKARRMSVAQLVLLAFCGPPPQGATCGRHLNGDCTDDRLQNLEYGTHKDNARDTMKYEHAREVLGISPGEFKVLRVLRLATQAQLPNPPTQKTTARLYKKETHGNEK